MIAFQQVFSDIVDLEQVLIRFINENDRSASALVIGRVLEMTRRRRMLGKHLHRNHQLLLGKGFLEAPYLLTARVFSKYLPHFQWIWEMKCPSPSMPSSSSSSCNQTCSKTSQGGGGATPQPSPWMRLCKVGMHISAAASTKSLRWLDTVFQGQYLPSLSINYVAINKVLEKLPPQLY